MLKIFTVKSMNGRFFIYLDQLVGKYVCIYLICVYIYTSPTDPMGYINLAIVLNPQTMEMLASLAQLLVKTRTTHFEGPIFLECLHAGVII